MSFFDARRTIPAILLFLLIMSISACKQSQSWPAERKQENRVVVAIQSRPESFDPRIGTSNASYRMQQMLFNYLVNQSVSGRLEAELATDWQRQILPDGTEVIDFYLREDVRFHDGSALTAADVVYTFSTLIDDDFVSRKKGAFAELLEVAALDDRTVRFHFSRRQTAFLSNLPAVGIIKQGSGENGADVVGSGPFILREQRGSELFSFSANNDYFLGAPGVDTIEIRVVLDDTTRALEFLHGGVDLIINDLSSTDAEYLSNREGARLITAPGLSYQYLGLNHRSPILSDRAVRKALAAAIDRQSLVENFLGGMARTAESPMIPQLWPESVVFDPQEYDPQRAKLLLDQAGYSDPDGDGPEMRFNLEFRCSNQRQSRELAAILQSMFARIGVGLSIKSSEWQTFYMDVINGRYELYSLRWIGIIDPSFFAAVFHSTSIPNVDPPEGQTKRGTLNRGWYISEEMDRLIEAAEAELDRDKRWQKYLQLQRLIDEDLPYIDLWYSDNFAVMRGDLAGLELSVNGSFAALRNLYYTENR